MSISEIDQQHQLIMWLKATVVGAPPAIRKWFPPVKESWDAMEIEANTPWNLTLNLKRSPWKRWFLLETIIFRFHVRLRGSRWKMMKAWDRYMTTTSRILMASVFSVSCDVSWHRKDGQRYVFVVGRFTVFPIVVSQHVSKQPPKPFSGHVFLQRHGMTLFWASSDISWNWWGRFKLHLESVLSYITLSTVSLLIYI